MKTLALNTFVAFENTITITSPEQLSNLVNSLVNGLDDDLFVVLYNVAATDYIGFSILTPKNGDLTRAEKMVELALANYADGALVYHMIVSPRNLMRESRIMADIDYTLAPAGITLRDYGFLRKGKLFCFADVNI